MIAMIMLDDAELNIEQYNYITKAVVSSGPRSRGVRCHVFKIRFQLRSSVR